MTSFCANLTSKNNFKEILQFFFRTTGLQLNLLILIESPNISHWQSAKKSEVGVWSVGQIWYKFGTVLWKNK